MKMILTKKWNEFKYCNLKSDTLSGIVEKKMFQQEECKMRKGV